jgi:hypothetical protein
VQKFKKPADRANLQPLLLYTALELSAPENTQGTFRSVVPGFLPSEQVIGQITPALHVTLEQIDAMFSRALPYFLPG